MLPGMSQAEISINSPFPVFVTNQDGQGALPAPFKVGTKWRVLNLYVATGADLTILEVSGDWIRCNTMFNSGLNTVQSVWLRPASAQSAAWEPLEDVTA